MTEQETLEYNKRCAEFLGWNYNKFMDRWNEDMIHQYSFVESVDLKFHSDWNWIMEVVEAIEKLGFQFNIYHEDCLIEKDKKFIVVTHATKVKTKKEAVVEAINQFLIWYEQNK